MSTSTGRHGDVIVALLEDIAWRHLPRHWPSECVQRALCEAYQLGREIEREVPKEDQAGTVDRGIRQASAEGNEAAHQGNVVSASGAAQAVHRSEEAVPCAASALLGAPAQVGDAGASHQGTAGTATVGPAVLAPGERGGAPLDSRTPEGSAKPRMAGEPWRVGDTGCVRYCRYGYRSVKVLGEIVVSGQQCLHVGDGRSMPRWIEATRILDSGFVPQVSAGYDRRQARERVLLDALTPGTAVMLSDLCRRLNASGRSLWQEYTALQRRGLVKVERKLSGENRNKTHIEVTRIA